jgi:integrase
MLSDKPRDLLLFTIGINNGLRAGDLLGLKVKDLYPPSYPYRQWFDKEVDEGD